MEGIEQYSVLCDDYTKKSVSRVEQSVKVCGVFGVCLVRWYKNRVCVLVDMRALRGA